MLYRYQEIPEKKPAFLSDDVNYKRITPLVGNIYELVKRLARSKDKFSFFLLLQVVVVSQL